MVQFQENARTDRTDRKAEDGQTEGRTDRQTPFSRALPATARVPITRS